MDLFKALAIDKPPLINVFLRMRCIKIAINVQGDCIIHTFRIYFKDFNVKTKESTLIFAAIILVLEKFQN